MYKGENMKNQKTLIAVIGVMINDDTFAMYALKLSMRIEKIEMKHLAFTWLQLTKCQTIS